MKIINVTSIFDLLSLSLLNKDPQTENTRWLIGLKFNVKQYNVDLSLQIETFYHLLQLNKFNMDYKSVTIELQRKDKILVI